MTHDVALRNVPSSVADAPHTDHPRHQAQIGVIDGCRKNRILRVAVAMFADTMPIRLWYSSSKHTLGPPPVPFHQRLVPVQIALLLASPECYTRPESADDGGGAQHYDTAIASFGIRCFTLPAKPVLTIGRNGNSTRPRSPLGHHRVGLPGQQRAPLRNHGPGLDSEARPYLKLSSVARARLDIPANRLVRKNKILRVPICVRLLPRFEVK